jgi:hypothetical protein
MRRIDPDIELVACGSSNERMPTFGRAMVMVGGPAKADTQPPKAGGGMDGWRRARAASATAIPARTRAGGIVAM